MEWMLLEFFLATDPAGRLSALVVVSTVLVAFALAAGVIAGVARATVLAAVEPAPAAAPPGRAPADLLVPSVTEIGAPLTGRPAPRAPDAFLRRSLRPA